MLYLILLLSLHFTLTKTGKPIKCTVWKCSNRSKECNLYKCLRRSIYTCNRADSAWTWQTDIQVIIVRLLFCAKIPSSPPRACRTTAPCSAQFSTCWFHHIQKKTWKAQTVMCLVVHTQNRQLHDPCYRTGVYDPDHTSTPISTGPQQFSIWWNGSTTFVSWISRIKKHQSNIRGLYESKCSISWTLK